MGFDIGSALTFSKNMNMLVFLNKME